MKKNKISPIFFNKVSQSAHFFFGATYSLSLLIFCPSNWILSALCLFVVAAAVKEFWYDRNYENPATRGSDLEDFLFYLLGAFVPLLLFAIKIHFS